MKRIIIYLLLPAYILTSASCMVSKTDSIRVAMEKNKTKISKDKRYDTKFAVCAADMGKLEGKMATLAETKASSPAVKSLARSIGKEHAEEHRELVAIAEKENISLPDKLSDRAQKSYDNLAEKDGKDFDKKFLKCAKKRSRMELCKVKKEAKKGKDPEIRSWASKNIPMAEKKKEEVKDACQKRKDEK